MATKYGSAPAFWKRGSPRQRLTLSGIATLPTNPRTERCPSLCTHRGNLRMFKNKGAVLVLLLSFCGFSIFHFLIDEQHNNYNNSHTLVMVHNKNISPIVVFTMCLLLYPLLGWLADVHFERHKMIRWSLRVIFVTLLIFCLVSAFQVHSRVPKFVMFTVTTLGLGGFQSSIIQFGIDQLNDASSTEITSFLRWYAWAWFLSGILVDISQSCVCDTYKAVAFLLFPTLIALAICLDMLCNHWLVKEKTSRNPFSLIFKVLRYAAKNKYPRLRNAFSYWDDRQYSRIDLAKTKFGGPYTTEQVEDVKTFFRIITVLSFGAFFAGIYLAVYPVYDDMIYRLHDPEYFDYSTKHCQLFHKYAKTCFKHNLVLFSGSFMMVVFLPFFEFVLHPFFAKFFQVSILKKQLAGLVVLILSLASCAAIEFAAQHKTRESIPGFNDTCPLTVHVKKMDKSVLSLDYKWMVIPCSLNHFSQYLFLTSVAEFLCAQSPYSMKGLLFGLTYGAVGVFGAIGYLVMLPLRLLASKKLSNQYGCLFWYQLFGLGILMTVFVFILIVVKCYKKRLRDNTDDAEDEEQFTAQVKQFI